MSLLAVEILLAIVAAGRGWRVAPALFVGLPVLVLGFEATAAALLAPWVTPYFEPAGVARAFAHGTALLGLAISCWSEPAEQPTPARTLPGPAPRRAVPAPQP